MTTAALPLPAPSAVLTLPEPSAREREHALVVAAQRGDTESFAALVRPSKSVHEVDARSIRKKMKDKAFARGVNRDDVVNGAADLGVDLDWHIQFVTDAMKAHAESLGLAGT